MGDFGIQPNRAESARKGARSSATSRTRARLSWTRKEKERAHEIFGLCEVRRVGEDSTFGSGVRTESSMLHGEKTDYTISITLGPRRRG